MFKNALVLLFLVFGSTCLLAQNGLNVYAGISQAKSGDTALTPDGQSHKGYFLGADARLNRGNMYFILSGQYHVISLLADEDAAFFSVEDKMTWAKLRFGLGYTIVNFSDKIALRAKTLLSLNLIGAADDVEGAPYEVYNAGTAGGHLGLGLDFFAFTFDVEYEKGFFTAVNMVDNTGFDFLTVAVGVKF